MQGLETKGTAQIKGDGQQVFPVGMMTGHTPILRAGRVVLAWVDPAGDDRIEGCPFFQQGLAAYRRKEDACTYPIMHYASSGAYFAVWTFLRPSLRCSNHVLGRQSNDNSSRG